MATPAITEAKAALMAFVRIHVPNVQAQVELSKLTASYVAAIIREERHTAAEQRQKAVDAAVAKIALDRIHDALRPLTGVQRGPR